MGSDSNSTQSISSLASTQKFQARDLPLKSVTVFTDRAELKRTFKVTLQEGLNDIVIENVAASIESDSIRVDGTGAASIHEVQFKTEHVTLAEVDTPQVKELVRELQVLKEKCAQIEDIKKIFEKRLDSLNDIIANMGKVVLKSEKSDELFNFNNAVEKTLDQLYSFHEKKSIEVNAKMRQSDQEQNDLKEDVKKLEQKIRDLRHAESVKRSIAITLESKMKEAVVELELSYQVFHAWWKPTYDVRVQTGNKTKFNLFYFGNIQQTSGEDWNDVEILLSTARPRCGGALPKLPTVRAQFVKPVQYKPMMMAQPETAICRKAKMSLYAADLSSLEEETLGCGFLTNDAQVEKHVLSTTFTIPQRKTIPSDTSEHKVTIVVLELDPVLHVDCVPSKNTNVFMTATAINSSTYPLLAGTASIYVDNSFSSKVQLKAVASGERFDCPLGVDPTINVHYKPNHKYQQQTGMISKSLVTMNEQNIVVKNTKAEPILLTLFENVPKSSDEKIRVKLLLPELKNVQGNHQNSSGSVVEDGILKLPDVGALLNDSNNLQWTLLLGSQEERELIVKWAVEYPLNEIVEYKED